MMRIVQLADIHFGAEDPRAIAVTEEEVARLGPDAIFVCGDLTQRGKRSEFEAASNWLRGLGAPLIATPGNHDTPLLNMLDRVSRPFERFQEFVGDLARPLVVSEAVAAEFNTARGWQARGNWAEGSVRFEELDRAIAETGEAAGARFVLCHHPFVSPPGSPLRTATRRGDRADARMAQSAAHVLLTGHVHAPSAAVRRASGGAYLAISAGTLSKRLRDEPASFNVLELDAGALSATAVMIGETVERRELGRWALGEFSS